MSACGQRPTLRTAVLQYVCPSRLLGTGCFGNVYKAEGPNKLQYAVKVSSLSDLSGTNDQCILREAVTLSQFAHMHVVKYFDCWEERDQQGARQLYLVMEYCQGRDLRYYMENTLQHPPEEEVFGCWLAQISSGLEHIHSHNVIHRNLKTSNVLVWCYKEQVVLKIGGFGLSKGLKHFNDVARSVVGTANFMSPELLLGKGYDRKTDIWSLGCTAYEIATLKSPKPKPVAYIETYVKYSPFFKDLIRKMLLSDADCRPGADVILKVLQESGYRPLDAITSTSTVSSSVSTVSSEASSSLQRNCDMTPVLENRARYSINSCEDPTSAKPPSQGIDIALNTLTLVRRAERKRKVNSRNRNSANSCEGTTSAKPSSQGIDVTLKTDTLSRRTERDQQMKKTVTFAPSTSLAYSSSGSGYETDISSFGMSGSFSASPRGLFNTSGHCRHSNTEMRRCANKNCGIEAPKRSALYGREGCSTNRSPDTAGCANIIGNTDPGDSRRNTASSGSGYQTDYDNGRDMWINEQIATLQPDIAQTIGREVFVALYPTLNIKDETLFTLHLMNLLEDYVDNEEVCAKMKRLWQLEKEKRERGDGR